MSRERDARPYSDVRLTNSKEVVDFVITRWQTRATANSDIEEQACENISFIAGHQWDQWNPSTKKMESRPRPRFRQRIVRNLLLPIVRREVANILRSRPTWKNVPVSNDVDDVMISQLSTKVLQAYWKSPLRMDQKLIELATWTAATGTAYLSVAWDPYLGPPMSISPDDPEAQELVGPRRDKTAFEALTEAFGKRSDGTVHGFLGDARIDVRSLFEIDIDRGATTFEEAAWLIDTQTRSVRWAREAYGDKSIESDANTETQISRHMMERVAGMSENRFRTGYEEREPSDLVLVHKLWTAPTRDFPRGYFAVVVNEKVRQSGHKPYRFSGIPYEQFKSVHLPGRMHGTCPVRHAIPQQIDLNKAISMFAEVRDRLARPKWIFYEGAGYQESDLQTPGKSIPVASPSEKPEMAQNPQIPDWVSRLADSQQDAIDDITSQHDVSQGKQPGSVRTGRGIEALMESDQAVMIPTLVNYEVGLSGIGAKLLAVLTDYVTEQRLVRAYGRDQEVESVFFKGTQLLGPKASVPGADYYHVTTEMVSQQPLTSAGREAQVINLVQNGLLDPRLDRDRIFKMLELGIVDPIIDADHLDRQAITRENIQLMQGVSIDINTWDDHTKHLEGHRRFQKRPEFSQAPDFVKSLFELHIQAHAHQLLRASQLQSQLAGGPPQAGPGASPGGAAPGDPSLIERAAQERIRQQGAI